MGPEALPGETARRSRGQFAGGQVKASMTTENGRAFGEWLRTQLKAKKMSQRQLAQQSGVDHSTISRLIRGDRMPSLGTATKLARGLREIRDDADTSAALGVVSGGSQHPTARVEYALRADEMLSEPQVRQIMEYYLAVRARRFGRPYSRVGGAETGVGGPGGPAAPAGRPGVAYGRSPAPAVTSPVSTSEAPATLRPLPSRYGAPRPTIVPSGRTTGRS
jgi:transcriptional regulator with XRE-family HTH domain